MRPAAHSVWEANMKTSNHISYKSSLKIWRLWTPTANTRWQRDPNDKKTCDNVIKKTSTHANKARVSREVSVGAQSMFKHGGELRESGYFRFINRHFLSERPLRFKVNFRIALMRVESESYCINISTARRHVVSSFINSFDGTTSCHQGCRS